MVSSRGIGVVLAFLLIVLGGCDESPTAPSGPVTFSAITAGDEHTCGLTTLGTIYCWGDNRSGQLGLGSGDGPDVCEEVIGVVAGDVTFDTILVACSVVPRPLRLPITFESLDAGLDHTCGIATKGGLICWGGNGYGQVGDGTDLRRGAPAAVKSDERFSLVSAGVFHTCAVTTDGEAMCWGSAQFSELGRPGPTEVCGPRLVRPCIKEPVRVSTQLRFRSVTAGWGRTCGISSDGEGYCWGVGNLGGLGQGSTESSPTPVAVSGGLLFTEIDAGFTHACGIAKGGAVYCWGDGVRGELGNGTFGRDSVPTPVIGDLRFVALSGDGIHVCGLVSDGAAFCWGDGVFGKLGDGRTFGEQDVPMLVLGGLSFKQIAAGLSHTCALTDGGAVYCWGRNRFGSLGDGTTEDSSRPVRVVVPGRAVGS